MTEPTRTNLLALWADVPETRPTELTWIPPKDGCRGGWEYYDDEEMIVNTIGSSVAEALAVARLVEWLIQTLGTFELGIVYKFDPDGGVEQWAKEHREQHKGYVVRGSKTFWNAPSLLDALIAAARAVVKA